MKSNNFLKKAIDVMGGQSALARAIGLKQQYIHNWLYRDKKVPAEHVLKVEKAVSGAVTRYDLRPDLYPKE